MTPFTYRLARDRADALSAIGGAGIGGDAGPGGTRLLGGGTNLVDLLRQDVEGAFELVDVSRLPGEIREGEDGRIVIDASVRNSTFAAHPLIRSRYPMLSRAILAGASAQIRNMATVAGNVMQRTRCVYFYDAAAGRCNKRQPGSGCDAIDGFNRYGAILGASDQCVATFPSDMCVALAALDAAVHLAAPEGDRIVPLTDFHVLPGDHPEVETVLRPGELITALSLPPTTPAMTNSEYRKVRDRSSFAFALISVAAGLVVAGGRIVEVRIAFGGVAAKPWRATRAEAALTGQAPTRENFEAAAGAELAAARALSGNGFKIGLTQRTMVALLEKLAGESA